MTQALDREGGSYLSRASVCCSCAEETSLLTDFLVLGVDREDAGMLDRFLRNILNVADSKFSTA